MDKRVIGERALRMRGWSIAGDPPPPDPVVIMVAAPHTSAWDFPLMLWLSWASGVDPHFLAKQELFRGPMGPFMRSVGGITVDRGNPEGVVDDIAARAAAAEHFQLVIAVEGTRKKKTYWKSGFYRIAQQADLPICLGWCDGPTRTLGYGPTIRPTGDVRADMDFIRAFYADKRGVNPELRTEPRLREEDEPRKDDLRQDDPPVG
jgi:1-acyl-sn-glycerol-3-phosphate acyltransferase